MFKILPPPASIVDVGCGVGTFPLMMNQLGYKVSCIDHPNAEDKPWLLENGIQVKKVNVEDQLIPFNNAAFELVTCLDVIEHLHGSPKNMLKEIHRVLLDSGFLFIETPNSVHLANRIKVLFGKTNYDDIRYFYNSEYPYTNHIREYTASEIKKVLQWSGFSVVNLITFNTLLDYTLSQPIDSKDHTVTKAYKSKYEIGFKLNSFQAILQLVFLGITMCYPNLRQTILEIAKKIN